jgi:hypothetical protein
VIVIVMVSLYFVLFIFELHALTSSGVTAFVAPSYQSSPCSGAKKRTASTSVLDLSKLPAKTNDHDNYEIESSNNTNGTTDNSVTILERARIISYRIGISATALCLCVLAVDDIGFLEGSGANIDQWTEQSSLLLPTLVGGALCFCPVPRNKIVEIGTISLGLATIGSSLIPIKDDISWSLSIIALIAISIREIWYFGVEYKQECAISISMLAFMFDNNNHVPFTIPLCALGISVLAAGKLFEPCQEDLVPSNSEFLAK